MGVLAGKQQREHRDVDIGSDAQRTQKVIQKLEDIGCRVEADWIPSRMEFKCEKYGYLSIYSMNLSGDGLITQTNLEDGSYVFQNDWLSETNCEDRKMPCISEKAQLPSHSSYDLTGTDHFDIKNLRSTT